MPLPKSPRAQGRAYLEQQLRKRGLSRRKAVQILNSLFAEMAVALARGDEVEFPLGKLKVVRHKHRTQTGRFLNRKLTTYKQPFTVVHETDREGEWLLNSTFILPPKPGSPPGTKPKVIERWNVRIPPSIYKSMKLPPKPWLQRGK